MDKQISVYTEESGQLRARVVRHAAIGVIKYGLIITLTVSFIFPFFWMASSAMKDDAQVYTAPPVWIPNPAHPENFIGAWSLLDFNRFTVNTVFKYAIPAVIGTLLSSVVVAYGFSRINWPGRNILFAICLATLMIPSQVRLIPLFVIFKELGWVGTYLPLVVPTFFGNAFFIFLLRQFFLTIPTELSDAARVDGANEFVIMWRIVLPLAKPALTVVALFTLLNTWNDYFGPLIYVNQEAQYTLALGINRLRGALTEVGSQELGFPYLMAVSTIVTLPIMIAFFFAQKTFIEGVSLTGLKG
ncbi:MAG: carbohydrate ABC transporter permease [Chloroflexi bacterium]|nr:carbohydrate ABC transporter permease [Chloroflexota bacterium]